MMEGGRMIVEQQQEEDNGPSFLFAGETEAVKVSRERRGEEEEEWVHSVVEAGCGVQLGGTFYARPMLFYTWMF